MTTANGKAFVSAVPANDWKLWDVWVMYGCGQAGGINFLTPSYFVSDARRVYEKLCPTWEGLDPPKHCRQVSSFFCTPPVDSECLRVCVCVCPNTLGIENNIWSAGICALFYRNILQSHILSVRLTNKYFFHLAVLGLRPRCKGQRSKSATYPSGFWFI